MKRYEDPRAHALRERYLTRFADELPAPVGAIAGRVELVCSPRLLEADCKTVEQMQLVNALCRFVELARVTDSA